MAGINAAPTCLIFRRDNNMRGVRGIDIGLTQGVRRSVDKSNARTCFDSKQDNQRCQSRRPVGPRRNRQHFLIMLKPYAYEKNNGHQCGGVQARGRELQVLEKGNTLP